MKITMTAGLLIGLVVLVGAGMAQAAPIPLNNPSFETPVLPDDSTGYYTSTIDGWGKTTSGTGSVAIGLVGTVLGPFVPGGAAQDGANILMVQADTTSFSTVQQSMGTAEAGKEYTVTAYVANFKTVAYPNPGYGIYLCNEAKVIMGGVSDVTAWQTAGMDVGASPTSDSWTQVSFTVTASEAQDGDEMTLYLSAYSSSETTPYVLFDNVSADVVPEPTTLGLLAVGGLLAVARKRRR